MTPPGVIATIAARPGSPGSPMASASTRPATRASVRMLANGAPAAAASRARTRVSGSAGARAWTIRGGTARASGRRCRKNEAHAGMSSPTTRDLPASRDEAGADPEQPVLPRRAGAALGLPAAVRGDRVALRGERRVEGGLERRGEGRRARVHREEQRAASLERRAYLAREGGGDGVQGRRGGRAGRHGPEGQGEGEECEAHRCGAGRCHRDLSGLP